jgi:hypothetical protein
LFVIIGGTKTIVVGLPVILIILIIVVVKGIAPVRIPVSESLPRPSDHISGNYSPLIIVEVVATVSNTHIIIDGDIVLDNYPVTASLTSIRAVTAIIAHSHSIVAIYGAIRRSVTYRAKPATMPASPAIGSINEVYKASGKTDADTES